MRTAVRLAVIGLLLGLAACATTIESPREPFQRAVPAAGAGPAPPAPFEVLESVDWRSTPPGEAALGRPALASGGLGLQAAAEYRLVEAVCESCPAPSPARWFLQGELVALPAVETDPAPSWPPSPLWIGAPELVDDARLSSNGRHLETPAGRLPLVLPPRNPLDRHGPDSSTARFFSQRPIRVRGATQAHAGGTRFVARTLWPQDSRFDKRSLPLEPLTEHELLSTLVSAHDVGDQRAFPARLLFDADPSGGSWAGKPALALVLSGAQGDDNGSHAGHLGVATGVFGPKGEWADWLVVNFYPHEAPNDKGITSATLPMDNYLFDVNSGQLYFRPGYLLVAVLRNPEAALQVQRALHGKLLDYYCQRIEYNRASNNSTAMSVDPLRALGWRIPAAGPTSTSLGVVGAPVATLTNGPTTGRDLYRAFRNETTRLLPRVAFEVIGHDLLYLAETGEAEPDLTDFERRLARDVEAVFFVRLPQVPSSRPGGTYPVRSLLQYGGRALADPVQYPESPESGERRLPAHLSAACPG